MSLFQEPSKVETEQDDKPETGLARTESPAEW
jgi:hypothetical protein